MADNNAAEHIYAVRHRHAVYTKARSALADSIDLTPTGELASSMISTARMLDAELVKMTERLRAFDAECARKVEQARAR